MNPNEKAKYTPGPWKFYAYNVISESEPLLIVFQHTQGIVKNPAEAKANLALCAAAPELLEALQTLVDKYMLSVDGQEEEWTKARTAIAKALNQTL